MDKERRHIAVIAGIVYFAQGALGIASVCLPIFMRNLNWSIAEITTVSSLIALPWILKIIYGLISDLFPLFGTRRKSYLIISSMIAAAGWTALAFFPASKGFIILALLIANLGFAVTDVVTDGLIVENSDSKTSPIYQSVAWGSRSAGAICSGFLGGWLAANWMPQHVFLLTASLPLFVMSACFTLTEPSVKMAVVSGLWDPLKTTWKVIRTSNIRWFLVLLVMSAAPASFGTPFFFHMKETLAFKAESIGMLVSIGWLGALIGSLIYSRYLKDYSLHKILKFAVIISGLNVLSTLLIRDLQSAYILVSVGGILGCIALLPMMSTAALLTAGSGVEGTLFALIMSLYNLSQILFGFLGGQLVERVGLSGLIVGSTLIVFASLTAVGKISVSADAIGEGVPCES